MKSGATQVSRARNRKKCLLKTNTTCCVNVNININCIEVIAGIYFRFVITEKKEEDLFRSNSHTEILNIVAPNGILVIPGKEAIMGIKGMSRLAIRLTDYEKLKL